MWLIFVAMSMYVTCPIRRCMERQLADITYLYCTQIRMFSATCIDWIFDTWCNALTACKDMLHMDICRLIATFSMATLDINYSRILNAVHLKSFRLLPKPCSAGKAHRHPKEDTPSERNINGINTRKYVNPIISYNILIPENWISYINYHLCK